MVSTLSNIRKEELSLFHYIKDVLLKSFIEYEEMIPLSFSQELSSTNNDKDPTTNSYVYELGINTSPAPYDIGRGWVYFDATSGTDLCNPYYVVEGERVDGVSVMGTPEQSERITVYDSQLNEIDQSEYFIDYADCRIITSGTCNPAYVDYWWHYVSFLDDWEEKISAATPIVVLDFEPEDKKPYQLGGGKKVFRNVNVYIFASNSIERNEIAEVLYDGFYLKSTPIFEFPLGTVLDYNGTWYGRKENNNKLTSLFDRTASNISNGNMFFTDVVYSKVKSDLLERSESIFLSNVNKYRAKIKMNVCYYAK